MQCLGVYGKAPRSMCKNNALRPVPVGDLTHANHVAPNTPHLLHTLMQGHRLGILIIQVCVIHVIHQKTISCID